MRIRKSERDYTNTHTHKLRKFGWCTNGLSLSLSLSAKLLRHIGPYTCSVLGKRRCASLIKSFKYSYIKQREHGNVQQPAIRNNTSREKLKKQHNITVYVSVVSYSLQQVQIVGVTSHWVSEHWTHYAIVLIPSILSILQLDIIYIFYNTEPNSTNNNNKNRRPMKNFIRMRFEKSKKITNSAATQAQVSEWFVCVCPMHDVISIPFVWKMAEFLLICRNIAGFCYY